ncbi:hypothetical protein C8F01DRAFT_1235606 [Mycena amicta]|nr:hypothetical protein C8F01DRAFT_1235606 [Mycena amicta]
MRFNSLSLLIVLCTLLGSLAAPIDSSSGELSISSRKVKAVAKPKPVKAVPKPKPATVKAAKVVPKPKPVTAKPAKAAPKPVKAAPKAPAKAAPKAVPKPVKAAPKPASAKAAPKPVPAKSVPKPVKAAPKPPAKAAPKAPAKACPLPKKGSKKARSETAEETENCEPPTQAELCAEITDCATCVGAGLNCAFDGKGDKCVPETTTGLTLATSSKLCTTLLAAEKASAVSAKAPDQRVIDAAKKAFSTAVQNHIFLGSSTKPTSGRHTFSAWRQKQPATTSPEVKRGKTTGVVEFKNGAEVKSVWNDVDDPAGTFRYTQKQIIDLCLRGYEQSFSKNPENALTLQTSATEPAGKQKLKLTAGLDNGFVVFNAAIGQNVCINISSASCFPLGTGTASSKEGDPCMASDSGVED